MALSATASLDNANRFVKYPNTYPFVPGDVEKIYGDVKRVTEDVNFERNMKSIVERKLLSSRTKTKPWTASYWPLSKGTIADPYKETKLAYYLDVKWVNWKGNLRKFKRRKKRVLSKIHKLSEKQLAKLAPSEKYDLLLGDKSFDLTHRLWDYMEKWGSAKENSFVTKLILAGDNSLDLANDYIAKHWYTDVTDAFMNSWNIRETFSAQRALELVQQGRYSNPTDAFEQALLESKFEEKNYVLARKSSLIAGWEGICNGWSTAAGLVPRPRKSIYIKLPSGKKLKFYPSDIRGLVSLYYVNSLIQDSAFIGDEGLPLTQGTVSAGMRCNLQSPRLDKWGRPFDSADDPFNERSGEQRDSRCAGVHPATWHMGLVNLIGVQGRSFVVERKVGAPVDNHPMYKYKMELFNPNTGKAEKGLEKNVERVDQSDQFFKYRHPSARYIVGVETVMSYMNYIKPRRKDTTSEEDDSVVDKKMYYDLELDENYNIVGGQWRSYKKGLAPVDRKHNNKIKPGKNTMPDFFWTITKNYKKSGWFGDREDVTPWSDTSVVPPRDWLEKAKSYHSFNYDLTVENGLAARCKVKHEKTRKTKSVLCEQRYNRPQPMINVINALVELAK